MDLEAGRAVLAEYGIEPEYFAARRPRHVRGARPPHRHRRHHRQHPSHRQRPHREGGDPGSPGRRPGRSRQCPPHPVSRAPSRSSSSPRSARSASRSSWSPPTTTRPPRSSTTRASTSSWSATPPPTTSSATATPSRSRWTSSSCSPAPSAAASSTPLMVGDLPFGTYEASDEQAIATAHRFVKEAGCDAVKLEGGGQMAAARTRHRRGRHAGHGPRRPDAADRDRARRLPRPGPHGRARAPGARRRPRAPGRRLLRDRLRGDPQRADRPDHGPHGDPRDRHRRRPQHRRPGARLPRPARHQRRLQAEVRQALRRAAPDDGRRRDQLRGGRPDPRRSPARSTPTASPRRRWSA